MDVHAEHWCVVVGLEIVRIPVLEDNYVWLVHESVSGETMVVDPAVAEPVLAAAEARGWHIGQIWNTHWHGDHTGGNAAIVAATGAKVAGPTGEREAIPSIDRAVAQGDQLSLGAVQAVVIDTPGHTRGHNAYYFDSDAALFCGDTLFAMGCGRLFEGTAAQMFESLAKLNALPGETRVYCAHEYTLANSRFAVAAEPDNAELAARVVAVAAARACGEATIPTTIALERATNPFLRATTAAQFAARREAKDRFRG